MGPGPDAPQAILRALSDLRPDPQNANRGTERGRGLLEHSLRTYGAGRSLVCDRNGVVLAGNKTLEVAADIGLDGAIVVPSDGTRVVVVQRTDLDYGDPRAKELALADNRVGEVSLEFDPAVLQELAATGVDLSKLWTEDELAALIGPVEPVVGPEPQLTEAFQVLVICRGEFDQGQLLERLTQEGYECRALLS